jgi:hypothetical protein
MRIATRDAEWESTITWSVAQPLDRFRVRPGDQEANFYIWLGQEEQERRLLYLGKTFDQYAHWRLDQPDHLKRVKRIRAKYPNMPLLISAGVLKTPDRDRYSRPFIDAIESLLIFVHQPEFNDSKVGWVDIKEWHYITNQGDYSPLERVVFFGPAVGEENE